MSKSIKKAITISIIVIIVIIAIISSFFIVKSISDKNIIEHVYEAYSNKDIQNSLSSLNTMQNEIDDTNAIQDKLLLQIDGETVLGVIKIDKIGFEGLIYESTSLETLAKGVGHFSHSPYFNGNVCLAAHNTNKFWAKLHTLQIGDKITYTSFLGTKNYYVVNITKIDETDWSLLQNSDENILTLITCVKNEKEKRLCIQAVELN